MMKRNLTAALLLFLLIPWLICAAASAETAEPLLRDGTVTGGDGALEISTRYWSYTGSIGYYALTIQNTSDETVRVTGKALVTDASETVLSEQALEILPELAPNEKTSLNTVTIYWDRVSVSPEQAVLTYSLSVEEPFSIEVTDPVLKDGTVTNRFDDQTKPLDVRAHYLSDSGEKGRYYLTVRNLTGKTVRVNGDALIRDTSGTLLAKRTLDDVFALAADAEVILDCGELDWGKILLTPEKPSISWALTVSDPIGYAVADQLTPALEEIDGKLYLTVKSRSKYITYCSATVLFLDSDGNTVGAQTGIRLGDIASKGTAQKEIGAPDAAYSDAKIFLNAYTMHSMDKSSAFGDVLPMICVILAALFGPSLLMRDITARRFAVRFESWTEQTAIAESYDFRRGSRGMRTATLCYRREADGKVYCGSLDLNGFNLTAQPDAWSAGDPVKVYVDPSDPQRMVPDVLAESLRLKDVRRLTRAIVIEAACICAALVRAVVWLFDESFDAQQIFLLALYCGIFLLVDYGISRLSVRGFREYL